MLLSCCFRCGTVFPLLGGTRKRVARKALSCVIRASRRWDFFWWWVGPKLHVSVAVVSIQNVTRVINKIKTFFDSLLRNEHIFLARFMSMPRHNVRVWRGKSQGEAPATSSVEFVRELTIMPVDIEGEAKLLIGGWSWTASSSHKADEFNLIYRGRVVFSEEKLWNVLQLAS